MNISFIHVRLIIVPKCFQVCKIKVFMTHGVRHGVVVCGKKKRRRYTTDLGLSPAYIPGCIHSEVLTPVPSSEEQVCGGSLTQAVTSQYGGVYIMKVRG